MNHPRIPDRYLTHPIGPKPIITIPGDVDLDAPPPIAPFVGPPAGIAPRVRGVYYGLLDLVGGELVEIEAEDQLVDVEQVGSCPWIFADQADAEALQRMLGYIGKRAGEPAGDSPRYSVVALTVSAVQLAPPTRKDDQI